MTNRGELTKRASYKVRPLKEKELSQIRRVWDAAGLMYRPRGRDSVRELKLQRRCDPDLFLGAFVGDQLIGVSIGTDDGRKGWVNRLAVVPEQRRKGVASALILESEKALRKRGRRMYCTHIVVGNRESLGLFKKLGYRVERDILYLTRRESEKY